MNIKGERVIGLDIVRAISILVVVFGHSFSFFESVNNIPILGTISRSTLESVLNLSAFGVELFFVLSGFLIGGILIKTFVAVDNFTFSEVFRFWKRRWFRTLPNYWLILSACFIVLNAMKIKEFEVADIKAYFFLQNFWYPNTVNAFPEGFSLSIEEWFYLTLPLVIFASALVFKPSNKAGFLLKVFSSYLLLFAIIRFVNAFDPLNGLDPDEGIRKVVIFRLDAVMYGVLFAWLGHFKPLLLARAKGILLAIGFVGSLFIFFLCIKYRLVFWPHEPPRIQFYRDAFLYLVVPLFLSLCLPYASSIGKIRSSRLSKVIRHISKISYSMYLIHYSLILRPFFLRLKPHVFSIAFVYYLFFWTVLLIIASLLYRYFEYPVMNLRDKVKLRRAVEA